MANHLIAVGIFSIIATAYIILKSMPIRVRKDARISFEIVCWLITLLKFVDINIMLTFHKDAIPIQELSRSFDILSVCWVVTLCVTVSFALSNLRKYNTTKGMRFVIYMQGLILIQLLLVGIATL